MKHLHVTTIGHTHILRAWPCQDFSASFSDDRIAIAAVADGHGADLHFRSATGSQVAVETAVELLKNLSQQDDFLNLLSAASLTHSPAQNRDEICQKNTMKSEFLTLKRGPSSLKLGENLSEIEQKINELLTNLIALWRERVTLHAQSHATTEWERENVSYGSRWYIERSKLYEIAYGTTLLASLVTPVGWLAFQIGDGKMILFRNDEQWEDAIDDDSECIGHLTTSLCQPNAINSFRYSFEGNAQPQALLLCTDGLSNAFQSTEKLANFYTNLVADFHDHETDELLATLNTSFPRLSKVTVGDDISLAAIYQ